MRLTFMSMMMVSVVGGAIGLSGVASAQTEKAGARNVAQYNVAKSHVAIEGYDPVAYFPEGGGKPTKGNEAITLDYNGVTYHFASKANLEAFKLNPGKYEPAHGGWCSYAMGSDGSKVEVDPKSFVVDKGRLFLFYKDFFNDTRASFLKKQAELTASADANWKKTSGETPRTGQVSEQKPEAKSPEGKAGEGGKVGLQKQLDDLTAQYEKRAPPERLALYNESIQKVAKSGVLESALKVGATAPDFSLTDAKGQTVSLSSMLKEGPVVLTWYRGGWCPFCNIQLKAYQDALPEMTKAGGKLVALTPELPDNSLSTQEKDKLEFSVLTDKNNKVAHEYGLAYKLPDELIAAFKGGLDLPKINGDESWELPLAATYVVGQDSKVVYAFVGADYKKRAEPAEIVEAIKAAKESAKANK